MLFMIYYTFYRKILKHGPSAPIDFYKNLVSHFMLAALMGMAPWHAYQKRVTGEIVYQAGRSY